MTFDALYSVLLQDFDPKRTASYRGAAADVARRFGQAPPGPLDLVSLVHMEAFYRGFQHDLAMARGLGLRDLGAGLSEGTDALRAGVHFNTACASTPRVRSWCPSGCAPAS